MAANHSWQLIVPVSLSLDCSQQNNKTLIQASNLPLYGLPNPYFFQTAQLLGEEVIRFCCKPVRLE
jgi:hypothetical protein